MHYPRFAIDDPLDLIQLYHKKGQFYDYHELRTMSRYILPDSVILDIGANVGNHTVYYSKFTQAKTIYVIEPIPKTCDLLLTNIRLNNCDNVITDFLGVALGNQNTIGYPFLDQEHNLGGARISPAMIDHPLIKKEWILDPVKVITGDSIFQNIKVDFIKIDVEGMELIVLEGLYQTISKYKPVIHIEIQKQNMDAFKQWITLMNYKIELVDTVNYNTNLYTEIDNIFEKDFYINFVVTPN